MGDNYFAWADGVLSHKGIWNCCVWLEYVIRKECGV